MKNNLFTGKLHWLYSAGFFIILLLPILTIPPWFFPPDWGKTIVFRSILSILIFLFICQIAYTKRQIQWPIVKKNILLWLLMALFSVFLLATIFSQDVYFSLWGDPQRSGGFINFIFYIIFAIVTFFVLKKGDWQNILIVSMVAGTLVCLVAIVQFYGLFAKIIIPVLVRPASTLGNPDFLGVYLLLLFFPTASLAIKAKKITAKLCYGAVLCLFLYVILITQSRAAYLGLAMGVIYFVFAYPKKLPKLKIIFCLFLVFSIFSIYWANAHPQIPSALAHNKFSSLVYSKVSSFTTSLNDARFSAWKVGFAALKEKPILGWGPENFPVAFDKHYDPSLPYLDSVSSDWWDKAHNIILDIGVQSGFLGIFAYLALLGYLFWKLHRIKHADYYPENKLMAHGIQTTLIAYVVANLFSFDNFETYLLFFLIIGYSLHLLYGDQKTEALEIRAPQKKTWALIVMFILFFILTTFIWRYNIIPFQANKKINIASNFTCNRALKIMEKATTQSSFLYVYSRAKYVDAIKNCTASLNQKSNALYIEKALTVMQEAVSVQPLFTRLWIFLGAFTTVKASAEQDGNKKTELLARAKSYLTRADQLAPNHHEVIIEQAKTDMVSGYFEDMKQKTEKCIVLYVTMGDCWWYKAISQIYLENTDEAQKNMQIAKSKNFNIESVLSLNQLVNAYALTQNYQQLVLTYEKLIKITPEVAQYHSSLAFAYRQMGEYKKARQEALLFLRFMPEAKDEVDEFLKTLPY